MPRTVVSVRQTSGKWESLEEKIPENEGVGNGEGLQKGLGVGSLEGVQEGWDHKSQC
jgi:hypothetical protein